MTPRYNLRIITPLAEKLFNRLLGPMIDGDTNTDRLMAYQNIYNVPENDPEVLLVASQVLKEENG